MRVKFIMPSKAQEGQTSLAFAQLLHDNLAKTEVENGLSLVETSPDVVHLFGAWTWASHRQMADFRRYDVPVVFTCIDGLQSLVALQRPSLAMKRMAATASALLVCGRNEQEMLHTWFPERRLELVFNPVLTSQTTEERAVRETLTLYNKVVADNDEAVRKNIAAKLSRLALQDKDIQDICFKVLYAHHFHRRGFLPQSLLQALTTLLTQKDYDEKHLEEVLRQLGMKPFMVRLMFVMRQQTSLTEGFMPFADRQDSRADMMVTTVTDAVVVQ